MKRVKVNYSLPNYIHQERKEIMIGQYIYVYSKQPLYISYGTYKI